MKIVSALTLTLGFFTIFNPCIIAEIYDAPYPSAQQAQVKDPEYANECSHGMHWACYTRYGRHQCSCVY